MADKTITKVRILHRHDTSANWTSNNPILMVGEIGYETDTHKMKFGDGTSHYIDLPYVVTDGIENYLTKDEASSTYQKQESGKGLSTNDFTNDLKTKVENSIQTSYIGAANGIPSLDENKKLEITYMPDGYKNIITVESLPQENQQSDVLYYVSLGGDVSTFAVINGSKGHIYHWDGTKWVDIDAPEIAETANTADRATADGNGNNIVNTYLTKTDASVNYVSKTGYVAYSEEEKEKLAGLENYTLPKASAIALGGVKIGSNIQVSEDGTISVADIPETDLSDYVTKETADATYLGIHATADKASADSFGNNINTTYATKDEVTQAIEDNQTTIDGMLDDYLPLTGGTITGDLTVNGTTSFANLVTDAIHSRTNTIALASKDPSGDYWTIVNTTVMSGDPTTELGIATKQYVDTTAVSAVENKVDKEAGKGLSTNDFTSDYKTRLDNALIVSDKGVANGVATLDANGKLSSAQLPDGWDEIISVATLPTDDQKNDVLYYVTTGGDPSDDAISLGTAGHMYRYVGAAGSGTWVDISSSNTSDKAVHDDAGNVISEYYLPRQLASTTYETITDANSKHESLQNALDGKVDKVGGKQLSTEDYTTEEKQKLAGLNNYTLPAATTTTLGGIKVGKNLTITVDGTLSAVDAPTLDGYLTEDTADGKYLQLSGGTITGALNVQAPTANSNAATKQYVDTTAASAAANKVDKEDGKGLSTNDYTNEDKQKLAGLQNYTLPQATTSVLGGVKVGTGLNVNAGLLSVAPLLTLFNTKANNYNSSNWINDGLCMVTYTASTITNQPTAKGILFNIPGASGSNLIFQMWLAIPDGYIAARAAESASAITSKQFVRLGTEGIIPGGTIAAVKQE